MRILFVAMPNSVHVARWINQISDRGWDLHLFPSIDLFSSAPERIHPDLRNITVYGASVHRPEGLDPSVRLRGVWPLRRASGPATGSQEPSDESTPKEVRDKRLLL